MRDAHYQDELAAALADAMPEQCQTCGGYKADDSTPKWVFRGYKICECAVETRQPGGSE